jgi:MFS family permease
MHFGECRRRVAHGGNGLDSPCAACRRVPRLAVRATVNADAGTPGPHSLAGAWREGGRYAWYVCVVMMLLLAISYMDRSVLALLVAPIEAAFSVRDTTMGLLQGAAFAVVYVAFAFPLARLADRGNRRNLVVYGVMFWCGATICCGLARSVPQLFLARMSVAAGEAVLMPAAVSILADYFGPKSRARALSVYSIGLYLGSGMAMGGGGALMKVFGPAGAMVPAIGVLASWRLVFILMGLVGLFVVPLLLGVHEPQRLGDDGGSAEASLPFAEMLRELKAKRAAVFGTIMGFALIALGATTVNAWGATLFLRAHGWSIANAGLRLGAVTLVLGPLGAITGGVAADWLAKRGRVDAKPFVGLLSASGCVVAALVFTLHSSTLALIGIGVLNYLIGFNFGIVQASLADLLPNRMRAVISALYIATTNILAATLGPLLVGLLNDHVFKDPSQIAMSLRIVVPSAFLLAALTLWHVLPEYRQALAARR